MLAHSPGCNPELLCDVNAISAKPIRRIDFKNPQRRDASSLYRLQVFKDMVTGESRAIGEAPYPSLRLLCQNVECCKKVSCLLNFSFFASGEPCVPFEFGDNDSLNGLS
jgi:hypothetical protein